VNNNNGVWIGWLDLLITPLQLLVITIDYNNSTIKNNQPNPSSWTDENSPHSYSDLILFCTTYVVSRRVHRKHIFLDYCIYSTVAEKRNLSDCCLRILYRGNVFTEPLPSHGSTRIFHNINYLNMAFFFVFRISGIGKVVFMSSLGISFKLYLLQ
jgi:hypothetical protein